MNPQRAGLLADLASTPWHLMRVLADEADDAGEPWLAAGWRWLAEYRKWPVCMAGWPDQYLWLRGRQVAETPLSAHLPYEAVAHLPRETDKSLDSLQERLLAGAQAVGLWLKDEADREAAKKELEAARAAIAGCTLCHGTGDVRYSNNVRDQCPNCTPLMERYPALLPTWNPPMREGPIRFEPPGIVTGLFGSPLILEPRAFITGPTLEPGTIVTLEARRTCPLRQPPLQAGDPVAFDEQGRLTSALPGEPVIGTALPIDAGEVVGYLVPPSEYDE